MCVVPGSTPVLSFGSPATASVATLGLNPSVAEFADKSGWLSDADRRLVDLKHLGVDSLQHVSDEVLAQVEEGCNTYFDHNPYWRWFRTLEKLLNELELSYVDGSACHLDLVQWATSPVWNGLTAPQRASLIGADAEFLRHQLSHENVSLVFMNGMTVVTQVDKHLASLEQCGTVTHGAVTAKLYRGESEGTRFFGWSCNLQGTPGANSLGMRKVLVQAITEYLTTPSRKGPTVQQIDKGHVVRGKKELAELLREWFRTTNEPTIGDVGNYGGKAWIYVELPGATVVLNSDTKRAAVEAYLAAVGDQGSELPWRVVANLRGRVNKVLYGDIDRAPGWFCYTLAPLEAPVTI
jgi:hypothetical protein